jgi:RNA polymerase-interacting CarD/CdnL/TRCF family regulator
MQFEVGDSVVHPVYGVGHIVKIEEKRFSEKETRLYYKITLPKRRLWIPIETHEVIGLRLVTAKCDLDQYRNLLRSRPVSLPKNHNKRHLELASRLKQCSFQAVCEVVRDLTGLSQGKVLGPTDRATLQKSREILYQEWTVAADVSRAEAIEEVESLLSVIQPTSVAVN